MSLHSFSLSYKLRMQLRVMPALLQQFIVRSSFNDLSLRQYEYAVRIPDC